jgi:predicted double-glycine peptidase
VDIKKADEEDRKTIKEGHDEYKKEMGFKIYEIKDQIDTELKNPNIV